MRAPFRLIAILTVLALPRGGFGQNVEKELEEELVRELERQKAAEAAEAAPGQRASPDPEPPPSPETAEAKTSSGAASRFIKGDLIYLGTRELVSRYDHVGVRVGPHLIGTDFFLGVTPSGAYYSKSWAFGLHVPINLLMIEGGSLEFGGAKIRREDWDEPSDYARLIRFITYGRKESQLYFTVTSLRPTTLGHGQLIKNYQPSIDIDRTMTGLVFEAYNEWAGFQLQLNDITFNNNVVGGLLFVKPLAFLDNAVLQSLSLGVEYAADFRAPRCVRVSRLLVEEGERKVEDEGRCVRGSGHLAGPDPLTGLSRDDTFTRTDVELNRPVVEETLVHAVGFSGELKVLKTPSSDLKIYSTFHTFIDGGQGITGGLLGRFNVGDELVNAFRARAEFRTFTSRFIPAYFDTLYEISKYQAIESSGTYQVSPTRYQKVFGDPENGFNLEDEDRRFGYNVELSWGVFGDGRSKKVAAGFGLEDSTAPDDTNFYFHLELPVLEFLQLFGTFLRYNAHGFGGLVDTESLDNIVVLGGLRVQILPFLFLNAHYSRLFKVVRSSGSEFHLGNERVLDDSGKPSSEFPHERIYENVQTLFAEIEIGWEFR